jgi:hypothetical protein
VGGNRHQAGGQQQRASEAVEQGRGFHGWFPDEERKITKSGRSLA